jgi:hypothetical protein
MSNATRTSINLGTTLRINRGGGGSVVLPWYLAGGISAANCIGAYKAKGAASLAASYLNLANPGTYDAAPGTAPNWTAANGWVFNGTTHHLLTGITPANTWSMIVRFASLSASAARYAAAAYVDDSDQFSLQPRYTSPGRAYAIGDSLIVTGTSLAAGVMALTPNQGYLDGVADGEQITPGNTTGTLYIGRKGSSATGYLPGRIYALAVYNVDISAYITALTTAMNAL